MTKTAKFAIFLITALVTTALSLYSAKPPIDGPAVEQYIDNTPEGKLVKNVFHAIEVRSDSLTNYAETSTSNNKAELISKIAEAEDYVQNHKLKFVRFGGWHFHTIGTDYKSDIEAWFKSDSEADLYVGFAAKFDGKANDPKSINLSWYNVKEYRRPLNFSYPANRLTVSHFSELSSYQVAAIILALASLLISVTAFVDCLLNWKILASKFWLIPVLIGIDPVQVSLGNGDWNYKLASIISLPGGLRDPLAAAGHYLNLAGDAPGYHATNIDGQMAYFSLPIALFYFTYLLIAALRQHQ